MLKIDNLVKRFNGNTAIDGLTLEIAPGELYALLGPNGAGKSTTINCLLGFLKPDEGAVEIDGCDCTRQAEEARKLEEGKPPEKQVAALVALVKALKAKAISGEATLTTHRDVDPGHTLCPGKFFPTKRYRES